jgi:DNA modification methylase
VSKPYYSHAGIEIYHGDCREVLPSLGNFDMLLTDPPYGVMAEGSAASRRFLGNGDAGSLAWDIRPTRELLQVLLDICVSAFIWGGCQMELGPTDGWLIWDKQNDGLNFGEVEFCWTNLKFAPRVYRERCVGLNGGRQHPTEKPIGLMKWCVGFAPEPRTILDPFMGSGTTLRAAKDLNLTALGIELSERYCEIAAKRLSQEVFSFESKP